MKPIGVPVDGTPARRPGAVVLEGRFGRVEKLDPARHTLPFWDGVRGGDAFWAHLPYGPFPDAETFSNWLGERAKLEDPFYYAILDPANQTLGVATLMEIRPDMRVIEVGHILYGGALQRTALATEAQYLLARYAFDTLKYRRYEWKCDALNSSSRRAAERFGFTFEGIFRQHMIVKGRSRDTAWYAMLDHEWPRCRTAFEAWLDPKNFDGAGKQRRSLEKIRNAL